MRGNKRYTFNAWRAETLPLFSVLSWKLKTPMFQARDEPPSDRRTYSLYLITLVWVPILDVSLYSPLFNIRTKGLSQRETPEQSRFCKKLSTEEVKPNIKNLQAFEVEIEGELSINLIVRRILRSTPFNAGQISTTDWIATAFSQRSSLAHIILCLQTC